MRYYKFLVPFLLLILALFLQLFVGRVVGVWISFTLAALICSAFFVDMVELILLILCAVFVLNWRPGPSWELVAFAAFPLIAFGLYRSRLLPFKPWLVNAIVIAGCILVFYALFGIAFFIREPQIIFLDMFACLCIGTGFFAILRSVNAGVSHEMLR